MQVYSNVRHRAGPEETRRRRGRQGRDRRREPADALLDADGRQMLRATPVPVYADAIADELAYVLENADVKGSQPRRTREQVDKLLSIADRLPKLLTHIVYDEDPWPARLFRAEPSLARRPDGGLRARRSMSTLRSGRAGRGDRRGPRRRRLDHALHVRHDRAGPKASCSPPTLRAGGARYGSPSTAERTATSNSPILPLAWVGDHYELRAGLRRRFLHRLSGKRRHGGAGPARNRPVLPFRRRASSRRQLTRIMIRMEDASAPQAGMFDHFIAHARKWGEKSSTARSPVR